MATVTVASPYAKNSSIKPRDDSLSSYLNLVRESFNVELSHTGRTRTSSFQFNSSRQRGDDGEIDIFGAEKYFNGTMDYNPDILPDKELNLPYKKEAKRSAKSRSRRTASTCSEASGNSRTGLLGQNSKTRKADGKNLLGVFLCSCSGEKSIDTDADEVGSTKHSFGERNVMDEIKLASAMRMERLEIGFTDGLFGGPANLKGVDGKQVSGRELIRDGQKKISICTRESLNSSEFQLTSFSNECDGSGGATHNGGNVGGIDNYCDNDDDIRSESSSDLFEISSISIKSQSFFDPDMDKSAVYEPSEASIQWSVVTASAANFSVASEFDKPKNQSTKESRKGLLMGCVSHKAVNVTTDSYGYKSTKRPNTIERPDKPVQVGHERLVAPAMRYRIQSLKKTELRPAPRQHATPPTQPPSHIQARQPIYMHS